MARLDQVPGCAHHVHLVNRGEREPTLVCSCPAGLIHMHDCPVTMGLACSHFTEPADESEALTIPEHEAVWSGLMADYLSRSYHHRIRALDPDGNAWQRRRAEIADRYAQLEDEEEEPADPGADEAYQRERDRLLAQRRKREEARQEREQRSREERAKERARLGFKTVVEKARESVAATGNVASSIVDDVKLPAQTRRRRRRRRGRGAANPEARAPAPGPKNDAAPRKKRRRRRRRKPDGRGTP